MSDLCEGDCDIPLPDSISQPPSLEQSASKCQKRHIIDTVTCWPKPEQHHQLLSCFQLSLGRQQMVWKRFWTDTNKIFSNPPLQIINHNFCDEVMKLCVCVSPILLNPTLHFLESNIILCPQKVVIIYSCVFLKKNSFHLPPFAKPTEDGGDSLSRRSKPLLSKHLRSHVSH